ncbi:aminotransferase [Fulvitalea axinellae]|uniref:phosphoserine transaminase n=1 Tax=Fulvitalea axinellae TaxID=1182444 RepID=A0AAU9CLK9_9BACT|nr:aminotransferase [Fulvitalea axinellae]
MKNRPFILVPGPSALYFTVEDHLKEALALQVPSISHRSEFYTEIHRETVSNIRKLLNIPSDFHVFFTGSATEVWERIAQNLIIAKSGHVVNGAFSKKNFEAAKAMGVDAHKIEAVEGDLPNVTAESFPKDIEVLNFTHNETSTGVMTPMDNIREARNLYPDAIISLDVVSSAPYVDIDFEAVDTAYFSVQKCFGLPAGLGVWIVNDRCVQKAKEKSQAGHSLGSYHSIPSLLKMAVKDQTPETPNVLGVYLLGKVAGDMLNKGLDVLRRETIYKSTVLYETLKKHPSLSPLAEKEELQSKTVVVAKCEGGSERFLKALAEKGLQPGSGYGGAKNTQIRIANFPTHSKELIEMLSDELMKID